MVVVVADHDSGGGQWPTVVLEVAAATRGDDH